MPNPRQKEIYWVNLEPTLGQEQSGIRPVVVISGNTMNEHFNVSIACPLSTQIKNFATGIVLKKNKLNNLMQDSEVINFQIRSITHQRFREKIGEITDQELAQIIQGLHEVLTY